jgi:hypothetical protein
MSGSFDGDSLYAGRGVCCDPAISDAWNPSLLWTVARRYAATRLAMLDDRVIAIRHM